MSGVRVGSRLEQLRKLRGQVDLQIELEERRELLEAPRVRTPAAQQPVRARRSVTGGVGKGSSNAIIMRRLEALGVTARDVKVWALSEGLLTELKRGTVAVALIDAFERAREREAPRG